MNVQTTRDLLKEMKMSAMAAELDYQLQDSNYNNFSFEERLALLVEAEWNKRQSTKLQRLVKKANFATPKACVEDIEYYEDRRLDREQIRRLSTCQFIDDGHHIILKGASGNGKTYIACALGKAACRRYKSVKYIRMPELLEELRLARGCGDLQSVLKTYKKTDLLIIDEWLIRCLTPEESYDILEIMEARCGGSPTKSLILCTQYEPDGWYVRINPEPETDSPISEAIMDRIIHNSYPITISGKVSMRERHGLNSFERRTNNEEA